MKTVRRWVKQTSLRDRNHLLKDVKDDMRVQIENQRVVHDVTALVIGAAVDAVMTNQNGVEDERIDREVLDVALEIRSGIKTIQGKEKEMRTGRETEEEMKIVQKTRKEIKIAQEKEEEMEIAREMKSEIEIAREVLGEIKIAQEALDVIQEIRNAMGKIVQQTEEEDVTIQKVADAVIAQGIKDAMMIVQKIRADVEEKQVVRLPEITDDDHKDAMKKAQIENQKRRAVQESLAKKNPVQKRAIQRSLVQMARSQENLE